jgi:hypothetical protein
MNYFLLLLTHDPELHSFLDGEGTFVPLLMLCSGSGVATHYSFAIPRSVDVSRFGPLAYCFQCEEFGWMFSVSEKH